MNPNTPNCDPPSDITRLARDSRLPTADDLDATVVTTPTVVVPSAASVAADPDATIATTPTVAVPSAAPVSTPAAAPYALPMGYRLHEYRIDKVLGRGGFGITYLAADVNLDARVAIKEYLPDQVAVRNTDDTVAPRSAEFETTYGKGLENYLVEARTLATFRHPHIVRVARFFEANNTAYMVLEYERGESLRAWWRTHADLTEAAILSLLGPLLDGLAVVHETGFLHRDIKPDNIYVRDADGSLVLLDFGAARRTSEERSDSGEFVTPGYGPIEQYEMGEQGPWTDVYALGATLYWMISGRKPPPAPERMTGPDPLVPAVEAGRGRYSEAFLKAVDWALAPEARDRPRDVAALREALFAGIPAALTLQAALRAGTTDAGEGPGWRAALRSPRLARARLAQAGRALLRPASWPLAVKTTLAMVLAALAPMLITAYYNYAGSVARVSEGELRNLEQLAVSVAGRVSQLVADSRNFAAFLASDPAFAALLRDPTPERRAAALARLESLSKANPYVDVATILDGGGTALASSNATVPGGNFRFRRYFQEAIAGHPNATGIIVGATAGGTGAFFAHPVRGETGALAGVVTLRIKAASFTALLEDKRSGTARAAMLVDGDGVILHHSDPSLTFKSLTTLPRDKLEAIVADQRFRRDRIESAGLPRLAAAMVGARSAGHTTYVSPLTGKAEIAGFAPVAGHEWVVGIAESREVFEAPLEALYTKTLYSIAAVGLVFVLLAVAFARSIVRPVEGLTRAAHALKSGDYDKATVPVTSGDEIGQLARVFNVMIDVLRQREREAATRKGRGKGG